MKQSNIIDLGVIRAVREMDDLKIQNFLWYFSHYEKNFGPIPDESRESLLMECRKEAKRRNIECDNINFMCPDV